MNGRIIQGQGYAIGVDRVKEIVPLLRDGTSLAWTGMGFEYPVFPEDLTSLGLPAQAGLIVRSAVPGTPAAAAGFGSPTGSLRMGFSSEGGGQAAKRRNTATAFWPPKPKPLMIAVSTLACRLTSGT
jgi:S1-C subfamily serine protease